MTLAGSGLRAWVERHRSDQWDIYVGANPRSRLGGRDAASVALARCLFVDFDGPTVEQALKIVSDAGLPPPTLVVMSGHGVHCWWRLVEPMKNLGLWTRYQKALIALVGSDPKIHDPPRILRVPGTTNWKSDPCIEAVLVGEVGAAVALEAMGLTPVTEDAPASQLPTGSPVARAEWGQRLSRATLAFMAVGAPEGQRNAALFAAAADLAGNSVPIGEAEATLLPPALRAGTEEWEALAAIRSAYSKARGPAKPDTREGDAWAEGFLSKGPPTVGAATPAPDVQTTPAALVAAAGHAATARLARAFLANVVAGWITSKDGEQTPANYYKPIRQFSAEISEATGGWPATAGGMLFVPREVVGDPLPGMKAVWMLPDPETFGAWLHDIADVRWETRGKVVDAASGDARTPPSKGEVHKWLEENAGKQFTGISTLPHEPPIPGLYYTPCQLPESDGSALREFLDHLNPETPHDRLLLLSFILTPAWGGEPGSRPAFVMASTFGRGSGKTATAQAVAEIYGGAITIKPDEDMNKVYGRLLSDDGLGLRLLLWDNLKGRQDSQTMDQIITAKRIDGHRMFHGQASRLNLLTAVATANTPKLSEDMTVRAVIIRLGRQRHGVDFLGWVARFLHERRTALLADIYAALRLTPVATRLFDRWQAWQRVPLGCAAAFLRLSEADLESAVHEVFARRGDANDDEAQAELVAEAITVWLAAKFRREAVEWITRDEMYEILVAGKLVEERGGLSRNAAQTWVQNLCTSEGALGGLKYIRQRRQVRGVQTKAGWEWRRPEPPEAPQEPDSGPGTDAKTGDTIPF